MAGSVDGAIMDTLLRALPYYILTVAALGTMMVVSLSVMRGMYPRRFLVLGAGMLPLAVAFFLIAATATPTGHMDRTMVGPSIRSLSTIGGLLWLLWLALAIKGAVRVEKQH
jgi:hypothetical protein